MGGREEEKIEKIVPASVEAKLEREAKKRAENAAGDGPAGDSEASYIWKQFKPRDAQLIKTDIVIHPTLLLSIADHYARAAQGTNRRAVGCLLGEVQENRIHLLNTFAVPFEEHARDKSVWYLDSSYLEKMYKMFRKIHAKERVVGWYSTASSIQKNDTQVHEIFRKYCPNPIFLVVDVHAEPSHKLPVQCYFSFEQPSSNEMLRKSFVHVNFTTGASEAEEVGVEHLLRDVQASNVSTLGSIIENEVDALDQAASHLQEISEYLLKVADEELPVNHYLMAHLQNLLNALPEEALSPALTEAFKKSANDSLLATYVAFASRVVMAVHALIKNKLKLKEAAAQEVVEQQQQQKDDASALPEVA